MGRQMMHALLTVLATGALALAAAPASAQNADWTVHHRIAVPLSGFPADLASLVPKNTGTVRIVLSGSVSSSLDGSEIDALGRRIVDRARHDTEGSYLRLPPGARIIESDEVAGRYVMEVPVAATMPISLDVGPLARRHLITRREAADSLSGAIVVEIMVPAAVSAAAAGAPVPSEPDTLSSGWTAGAIALGLGAPLLLGFGLARRRRRRRDREEDELMTRARQAASTVETEAGRLGPAFDEVIASARRLLESASKARAHVVATEAAIDRTAFARSESAAERRAELTRQRDEALIRLRIVTERLEDTAVRLAGRHADHHRDRDAEVKLEELASDLDMALAADEEAYGEHAAS